MQMTQTMVKEVEAQPACPLPRDLGPRTLKPTYLPWSSYKAIDLQGLRGEVRTHCPVRQETVPTGPSLRMKYGQSMVFRWVATPAPETSTSL